MTFVQLLIQIIIVPIEDILNLLFSGLFQMFEIREVGIIGTSIISAFLFYPFLKQIPNKKIKQVGILKSLQRDSCTSNQCYLYADIISIIISMLIQSAILYASYRCFSALIPEESSFLFISDLAEPDKLISIRNTHINLLPIIILFTKIVPIFFKKESYKEPRKWYILITAITYFVFLYSCPSSVTLFWLINGFIIMASELVHCLVKDSNKVFSLLLSGTSIATFILLFILGYARSTKRIILLVILVLACQIPFVTYYVKKRFVVLNKSRESNSDYQQFIIIAGCLSLLLGVLIPSTVVKSSPTEYLQYGCNPLIIVLANFANYFGLITIWLSLYYWISEKNGKAFLLHFLWVILGICFLNFFFFNRSGVMNPNMTYSMGMVEWENKDVIINLILVIITCIGFYLILRHFSEYLKGVTTILLVALLALSVFNCISTGTKFSDYDEIHKDDPEVESGILELSKKGKNVVFIMLDRAAGGLIPYVLNEKPEIKELFSGFTFYPNTLSQGQTTNYAAPVAYGGYEYTPKEMNRKSNQLLKDKHNEALMLLPTLFSNNGFSATTCDPPYAGYQHVPDLRIFNSNKQIKAYNILSSNLDETLEYSSDMSFDELRYNFKMYSIMKVSPAAIQSFIYNDGYYGKKSMNSSIPAPFLKSYAELEQLDYLTNISEENEKGSLLMIYNAITHEPINLQLPEYEIKANINNTDYEPFYRVDEEGGVLDLSNERTRNHYYVMIKALQLLGQWFDYLRENNVYDNTRIVIVGDHSHDFIENEDNITEEGYHIEQLNPVLMVKDFDDRDFDVSDEFMTIGDVPAICIEGIIDNPINPYTKNSIYEMQKFKQNNQEVIYAIDSNVDPITEDNYIFKSNDWYLVENDIHDISKWHKIDRPYS